MRTLEQLLATAVVNQISSDARPKFATIIEDDERGEYSVGVKRYIDADRAGFCGWVSDPVIAKLDQSEAVAVEAALNAEVERRAR